MSKQAYIGLFAALSAALAVTAGALTGTGRAPGSLRLFRSLPTG